MEFYNIRHSHDNVAFLLLGLPEAWSRNWGAGGIPFNLFELPLDIWKLDQITCDVLEYTEYE